MAVGIARDPGGNNAIGKNWQFGHTARSRLNQEVGAQRKPRIKTVLNQNGV
jgi:hypothetical protein